MATGVSAGRLSPHHLSVSCLVYLDIFSDAETEGDRIKICGLLHLLLLFPSSGDGAVLEYNVTYSLGRNDDVEQRQLTHIVIIFLLAIFGQGSQVDEIAVDLGQAARTQRGRQIDSVTELGPGAAQVQIDKDRIDRSSVVVPHRMVARRRRR